MTIHQFLGLWLCMCSLSAATAQEAAWQHIDTGLDLLEFKTTRKSVVGDQTMTVLRIAPQHFELDILSAKQPGEHVRTARGWAEDHNLVATVNAGMYMGDFLTNVGYMKIGDFFNNSKLNKDNCILAIGPLQEGLPEVQIIDLKCQNWSELKSQYRCFSQSIRMVDCNQRNTWSVQEKQWSTVAVGMDKHGNVLFAFSRSPYRVHDFIAELLEQPLDLYNLMYLEGGPEASFYLNHNGVSRAKFGSYETGFMENEHNSRFWVIPNVIGVRKRNN